MQQKNANAKVVFALAGVILLVGIALAAVFLVGPRPEETAQPAREPAKTPAAAEIPAKPETGMPPLLLALIIIVIVAAAARVIQLVIRKKILNPVGGGYVERLRQIALEINSWTQHSDPGRLERLKRDARQIGEELFSQGGLPLMLRAYFQAGSPKEVDSAWEGVGAWKG